MAATTTARRSMSSPTIAQPLRSPIPPRGPGRSDVFKPRLPLDPFSSIDHRRHNPIVIPAEKLHSAAATELRRDVILVLGAPEMRDLEPLFQSEQFSSSLLILATHQPPTIQPDIYPVIRVLRLNSPLALENSGAVRFVQILESAERLARFWRRFGDGGIPFQEVSESDGILEYPAALKLSGFTYRANMTPSASSNSLSQPNLTSRLSSSLRITSFDSSSGRNPMAGSPSSPRSRRESKLAPLQSQMPDPTQRPFDAIINFLPHDIPEKSMLKHAILVTTISRPFLVAAVPPSSFNPGPAPSTPMYGLASSGSSNKSSSGAGSERRKSVLRRPPILSMYSMPPTPPMSSGDSLNSLQPAQTTPGPRDVKAHLVHLLPSSQGKSRTNPAPLGSGAQRIAQSIESFLLSFSYPGPSGASGGGNGGFSIGSGSGMGMGQGGMGAGSGGDGMEHAKAYLMDTSAFREVVDTQMVGPGVGSMQETKWTVASLVLSGCLDVDEEKAREQRKAVEGVGAGGAGTAGGSAFVAKQEVRMMSKQRAWVGGASEIIISAVPSNIVTATGLGISVTPPSVSSVGSGSSFSSLSAAAASASLSTSPSASAHKSSPSLPLNKSKLLPPTPITPTRSHRRHHSKSDPSYSPSSMETIRAPSSTLSSPGKEPLPPRRHSANAAAVAAATSSSPPPTPGQASPTKVGFAGIGSGYGASSSSSPYSKPRSSRAASVSVPAVPVQVMVTAPAPAVRPSTHTKSHSRSASGSGSGSAVDPEVGQTVDVISGGGGVNGRVWPSSAPAHSSGMKHYMAGGQSGGNSGASTVMPTPSSTTLVEVRTEQPVSPGSPTGIGSGMGSKRSLRRVEGSRKIVAAAPPTPPDSEESANVDRNVQEKEKAAIKFEDNVYLAPVVAAEEISSEGGKRRVLHKGRGRGEGDVPVDANAGEKQVKRVSSGTSSRWKFWKSAAR